MAGAPAAAADSDEPEALSPALQRDPFGDLDLADTEAVRVRLKLLRHHPDLVARLRDMAHAARQSAKADTRSRRSGRTDRDAGADDGMDDRAEDRQDWDDPAFRDAEDLASEDGAQHGTENGAEREASGTDRSDFGPSDVGTSDFGPSDFGRDDATAVTVARATDSPPNGTSDIARRKTRAPTAQAPTRAFPPPLPPATMRQRHYGLVLSFLLFVLCPIAVSGWYLWTHAVNQYASYVGFSVQKEDTDPAVALLGGITSLSSSASSDTDILYEYMYSQTLVAEIDRELDLRGKWSKAPGDPVFNYSTPGTIEDLTEHWGRKVKVFYDSGTRLIEVRVLAFDPDDAQAIAGAIFAKSTTMINDLAETAREDSVRYAREELDAAQDQLKAARASVTAFRNRNRMVDPATDVASQSGLLANLQGQLADALIELDTLRLSAKSDDPRIPPAERKVRVIEARIEAERNKLGSSGVEVGAYADIVAEYEGLAADREFAEEAYKAARSSYDAAQAEARRQGRYLAAYVPPTRAEASLFPERWVLLGLIALFAFTIWSICALLYYSLRDRR